MKFKVIPEAPFYLVSDEGHIRSLGRMVQTYNGKVWCFRHVLDTYPLKEKDIRGYKNVSLIAYDDNLRPIKRYTRQVHRLVLETFKPIPNMKDLQVNHINGDKSDNRLENLEWTTAKDNTKHTIYVLKKHKTLKQYGELNSMAKLTENDVKDIINLYNTTSMTQQQIGDLYNVSRSLVGMIIRGDIWTHIDRQV